MTPVTLPAETVEKIREAIKQDLDSRYITPEARALIYVGADIALKRVMDLTQPSAEVIENGIDAVLIVKNQIMIGKGGNFAPGTWHFINGGTFSQPFTAYYRLRDDSARTGMSGGE